MVLRWLVKKTSKGRIRKLQYRFILLYGGGWRDVPKKRFSYYCYWNENNDLIYHDKVTIFVKELNCTMAYAEHLVWLEKEGKRILKIFNLVDSEWKTVPSIYAKKNQ